MAYTTEKAFDDLPQLTGKYKRILADVKILAGNIERLEELKAEILDDSERKADIEQLIDIHPVFTVAKIKAAIKKLTDLYAHLEAKGFL